MPEAVIIAGANGAGKTTFARKFVPARFPEAQFINADEISRESDVFAHPVAAGREMLRRLRQVIDKREDFAIETTLASRSYAQQIPHWQKYGYRVTLHFIKVPSADFSVDRVAQRVAHGGHQIPEADIRRRYERGLHLFNETYRTIIDAWYHWATSNKGLSLVAENKTT
ncbi:MAG: zeta toxin family protein [Planctomycetota bacterium]